MLRSFPTHLAICSGHWLHALKISSILTLSTGRQCQIPQACSPTQHFRWQLQASGCDLCFWSTGYTLGFSCPRLLRFNEFAKVAHRTQGNTLLMFDRLLQRILKRIEMNIQMRDASGEVWQRGHGASVSSLGTPPSRNLHVLGNPESLQTLFGFL